MTDGVQLMTNSETAVTHDLLVERARGLVPVLRARADEADQTRRLHAETVDELVAAGLTSPTKPALWGGPQLGFDTVFDIGLELARGCPSTSWVTSVVGTHGYWIACFPEATQQLVWGTNDTEALVAASLAPVGQVERVKGGYRISGRFDYASGVDYATCVLVGAVLRDDDKEPAERVFLVWPSDYTIHDTWHTVGMRGTGSNLVVVEDAFVPDEHTLALDDILNGTGPGADLHDDPLYRLPMAAYGGFLVIPALLGTALSALEAFVEWQTERVSHTRSADSPHMQLGVGRAAADLRAAELVVRRLLDESAHAAVTGDITLELRARFKLDFAYSGGLIARGVETLMQLAGTRGMFVDCVMERAWRDVRMAATHITLDFNAMGTHYGRLALGLPRDPKTRIY